MGTMQGKLSSTSAEARDKTTELKEMELYYSNMVEAKEASITSLQKLLASQQKAFTEQQQVRERAVWHGERSFGLM